MAECEIICLKRRLGRRSAVQAIVVVGSGEFNPTVLGPPPVDRGRTVAVAADDGQRVAPAAITFSAHDVAAVQPVQAAVPFGSHYVTAAQTVKAVVPLRRHYVTATQPIQAAVPFGGHNRRPTTGTTALVVSVVVVANVRRNTNETAAQPVQAAVPFGSHDVTAAQTVQAAVPFAGYYVRQPQRTVAIVAVARVCKRTLSTYSAPTA